MIWCCLHGSHFQSNKNGSEVLKINFPTIYHLAYTCILQITDILHPALSPTDSHKLRNNACGYNLIVERVCPSWGPAHKLLGWIAVDFHLYLKDMASQQSLKQSTVLSWYLGYLLATALMVCRTGTFFLVLCYILCQDPSVFPYCLALLFSIPMRLNQL